MTTTAPTPRMSTGSRLGTALLAYLVLTTLIITLLPFKFRVPASVVISWTGGPRDILANIALFVPLGFLYHFARSSPRAVLEAVGLSILLSAMVETLQLMERDRIASVVDVLTNGLGGWLGAFAFRFMATRGARSVELVGWTAFELPLMGLVYLLLPLLWLDSLAAAAKHDAIWLTGLLGLTGAGVIGALQRHLFARAAVLRPWESATIAMMWFVVGTYPILWYRPALAIPCIAGAAAIVAAIGSIRNGNVNRRFEVPVISFVMPLFITYLLFLALYPATSTGPFSLELGFGRSVMGVGTPEILRLVEYVTAFTLLGYMVAEMGSRREETFGEARMRILRIAAPQALAFEILRGFHPFHGFSPLLLVSAISGSLYGGMVFHLARAHARELRLSRLSSRPPVPPGS